MTTDTGITNARPLPKQRAGKPVAVGRRQRLIAANLIGLVLVAHLTLDPVGAMLPRWEVPATGDPLTAVTAIAERHIHGPDDDGLAMREVSQAATHRTVVLTCGQIATWAIDRLALAGFEARLVHVLTLDTWNAWDNGHTLIEVRGPDGWTAYDLDRKVRWTDSAGQGLSMVEWMDRVLSGDYRIVPLLDPVDEPTLRRSDRRWADVAFVKVDGLLYFASRGRREDARILAYAKDYRVVPRDRWAALYAL